MDLFQYLDSAVANFWLRLNKEFLQEEPRLQFTALTSLVHAIAVYSSAAFFMALRHFGWCKRFRIQGEKEPDRTLVRKCQIHMIISCLIRWCFACSLHYVFIKLTHVCFSFPSVMFFIVYPLARRNVSEISSAPSVFSIFLSLILFVVSEDCLFYWLHRASHHPYVYAYVHKQHHEFKINHPLCYEYSTILEGLFVNTGFLAANRCILLLTNVCPLQYRLFLRLYSFKHTLLHFVSGSFFE